MSTWPARGRLKGVRHGNNPQSDCHSGGESYTHTPGQKRVMVMVSMRTQMMIIMMMTMMMMMMMMMM
eukprot:1338390-Karenia_brevis.AAC.1